MSDYLSRGQLFRQAGLSLVELMVAITISMVVSIAIFSTLLTSQQQNKTTTSVNSRNQAGAFASYQLDQLIRNAGTGLLDYSDVVAGVNVASYGCLLHVAKNGQTLLPSGTFSAPFDTISGQVRLAPFLIQNGAADASDILMMMSTGGVLSSLPGLLSSTPTASELVLNTLLNYKENDLLLMVGSSLQPCIVSQVQSTFTAVEASKNLPLSGEYANSSVAGVNVGAADDYVVNLGQTPKFLLLGVSEQDHNLYQYDLLQPKSATVTNANPNLFIENVYSLQAIYGVDPNNDGDLSDLTWVQPTGTYSYANLSGDPTTMQRIKAVKVAMVVRADLRDAKNVADNTVTIFADTAASQTVSLSDLHYRYRAFEVTVPIRNSIL